MESPLRYLSSDECSSAWLKFHLGLPNQSSQRSIKRPNPQQQRNHHHQHQQQQQQQQQHLNTLGLRLNAAGKIKPSVVNMPSMEHRWKIHYSYKTKALTRSINTDDAVMIDPPTSQRSAREWSRSESGKRSPHDAGKERTNRVRSAASGAVLARGREQQRSPRNRDGTPELVTTTPIRLLGVLRSPEHAPLNWRGNDGQQQPPRYFVFPPVTGSRPGATPLVRRERRVQASTAPMEARSRSGLEKEDDLPMTFSRSSSSESLPSSWKYADGRQTTTTTGTDVTDDRTPHHMSQSTETLVLPTIDEEDAAAAAASEASHRISVRISRNNSFNNRYNNNWNNSNNHHQRLVESDELRIRVDYNVDEDASDSLSVYDDDSEGDAAEAEPKPSSPVLAISQVDEEGINGNQNEDHIGDQNEDHNGDQNEDHCGDQNENHIGVQNEGHIGDQREDHTGDQNEANIGDQNEDQLVDQSKDHIGDQYADHNGNKSEDHIGDQNEDHIGDQHEDRNGDQNSDHQNADLSENLNCDQSEHLNPNEKTDSRKCCENDYQEIEAWTKEATDFSTTQRAVYPPLTSRGRASESPPPILRDIPIATESHTAIETTHITDKQQDSPENKVLGEIRHVQGAGELVEDWKEAGANDIGSPEVSYERRDQDVRDERDEGDSNRGWQQREEPGEQTIECRDLKDTTDENNNVSGTQDRNEVKNGNGETRETPNDTETRVEADSTKVVEFDSPESLAGNVDGIGGESNESKIETVEQLKSIATELSNATDSQSDPASKVNHPSATDLLDDLGQQQNGASPDLEVEPSFTDEKVDGSSVESASLESTIASGEERRSPPTGKAAVARKRSVRFSQDVVTVYLYIPVTPTPDDSDTSDSGFLSP